MSVTISEGWTIGPGWVLGSGSSTPPAGTGSITYAEMPGPVDPFQFQDPTAVINDPVGFTINNSRATGVFATALTQENIDYFNNQGVGTFLCTLGAGSTVNNIYVNITSIPSDGAFAQLVWFFDPLETYPATFNYPFTIS